jgi:S-adenosylmethionine decarboxylase
LNTPASKLKLYGFNNLTKNLSFSLYKLHYINNSEAQEQYQQFINQTYSADKLNQLLTKVCHAIGGNVLNVAQQNYQPQGASVTLMISEELQPQSLVAHLDKSHLCVHTYPDNQITNNVAIFRADIELSTCGVISPLKVINYLMETLQPDIAEIDFRVRGMTRDIKGNKLFIDDKVTSISEHLNAHIKDIFEI